MRFYSLYLYLDELEIILIIFKCKFNGYVNYLIFFKEVFFVICVKFY